MLYIIVGLQRLQHIFRSERSNHRVRFAFRRLENVFNAHEDLKHLDQNAHEDMKNIVLDLSSQEAYIAIMRQVNKQTLRFLIRLKIIMFHLCVWGVEDPSIILLQIDSRILLQRNLKFCRLTCKD